MLPKDIILHIVGFTDCLTRLKCRAVNSYFKRIIPFKLEAVPYNWKDLDLIEPLEYLKYFSNYKNFINWIGEEEDVVHLCDSYSAFEQNLTEVYYYKQGEHDGPDWHLLGKIKDFYFFMNACCDYTGFDCQGSIRFYFSRDLLQLIKFGLGDPAREDLYTFLNQ